ncbi:hypothetical protein [Ruminococcus sp. YE71]|uniref:hypothetical protein n=1 Tax=Ruminococcus sp. YE71 TaxID=244362 RepID=UPI001A9A570A|nr:hypothetical protein [Ruminococcus sp. YE71]
MEYVYVSDGVYNKRGNIKEAEKIVELLANHFINHPERSVGIITFSINQQSVIEKKRRTYRKGTALQFDIGERQDYPRSK